MALHIVYPYVKSKWGEELKYSLRSLEKHLKAPYDVTIIGQCPEYVDKTKVTYISTNFHELKKTNPLFKSYSNLKIAAEMYDNFIFWHDDIYLLKDVQDEDLRNYYFINKLNDKSFGATPTGFLKHMHEGYERAKNLGYFPLYNSACHVPIFLNSKKLFEADKELDIFSGNNIIENAYITYHKLPVRPVSPVRFGFWGRIVRDLEIDLIKKSNYIFLNHDDRGLKPKLKQFIQDTFNEKSRFEI